VCKKLEQDRWSILAKIQAGKEKTGIVMKVVNGKPQFVHGTFAEYFRARSISRNFKFNTSVLERIFLILEIG
jgi:hypothetical protein